MDKRKWCVKEYDKAAVETIVAQTGAEPYTALLLSARAMTQPQQISAFLDVGEELCDPFLLPDMQKAAAAIVCALDNGERIAVYGDYDADGVTATALLYTYLLSRGADVLTYIPDRNAEGYGLNRTAIDCLHARGAQLIVTVDNGVSSIDEAEYIRQLGMKLVITDHHKVPEILPDAIAIVDAHRRGSRCPFCDWAGVGVAFKLVCALEDGYGEDILDEYCDLITVGTIADVVPLTGENRYIVRRGLEKLRQQPGEGLTAVMEVAGLAGRSISATGVAYSIVPRINAVGRIGSVKPVLDLLTETGDLLEHADILDRSNRIRQETEQHILQEAFDIIRKDPQTVLSPVIILEKEGWHTGVVGIVAAKLVEKYCKPCLVISCDGEDAKGSGRSVEGFSLFDALCVAKDKLTHFGGHTLAVGFSLKTADIPVFKRILYDYACRVGVPPVRLELDCRLRPEALELSVVRAFSRLEPFGAGNPQPLVGLYGVTLSTVQPIGNGKHLRLGFTKNQSSFTALRFGVTQSDFPYEPGDKLDLAVRLEENEYRGETKLSIQIKAIRPAGRDDDGLISGIALYEKLMRGQKLTRQQAQTAFPDRGFVSTVYKAVRDRHGRTADLDKLCMTTGFDTASVCRTLVSVEVLTQLAVLEKDEKDNPVLPAVTVRTELDRSALYTALKTMLVCE